MIPPWVANASKRILEVDFIRDVALATARRITSVLFSRGYFAGKEFWVRSAPLL